MPAPTPTIQTSAPPPPVPLPGRRSDAAGNPDFSRREYQLSEWMDEPCTFAEYFAAVRSLGRVNRVLGAHRNVIAFLQSVVERRGVAYEPLHIVDVGCADGDKLRSVARWAARHSVPVRLTGVDLHPYAARAARLLQHRVERASGSAVPVNWITGNVFEVELPHAPDVLLNSLMGHHLTDTEIVEFLRWQARSARWGWLMTDLRRSQAAFRFFPLLASVLRMSPIAAHDGPVSFRRALSVPEWKSKVAEAGVDAAVRPEWPAHVAISWMRQAP